MVPTEKRFTELVCPTDSDCKDTVYLMASLLVQHHAYPEAAGTGKQGKEEETKVLCVKIVSQNVHKARITGLIQSVYLRFCF